MVAPDQEFACKQIDERHRDHVAHHAHQIGGQDGQAHAKPDGDGTAQFNERHHGNEKYQQIAFEHRVSFSLLFPGEQAFFTGYRSMSSSTGQWSEPKISLWISAARILSAMRRDTIK